MSAVVHDPGPVTVEGDLSDDVVVRLREVVAAAVQRALDRVPPLELPVPASARPAAVEAYDPTRADPEHGVYRLPSYRDEGRLTGAELLERLAPRPTAGATVAEGRSPVEGALIAQLDAGHEIRYVNLRSARWVSAGNLTEAVTLGRLQFPEASFGVVQGPVGGPRQRYLALATDPVVADADLGEAAPAAEEIGPELEGRVGGVRGEDVKGTVRGRDGEYLVRALVTKDGVPHWRNAAMASMWFAQGEAEARRGLGEADPEAERVALFDDVDALLDAAEAGDEQAVERAAALLGGLGREAFALVDWETKVRYVKILVRAWTFDAQERAIVEICASLRTPTELDAVVALLREGEVLEAMLSDLTRRRYELLTLVGRRFGARTGGLTLAELGELLRDLGLVRPSLAGMVSIGPDGELEVAPEALLAEAQAAVDAVEGFVLGILELLETIVTEPVKLLKGLAGLAQLLVTITLAQLGYPPALREVATLLAGAGRSVLDGARGATRMGAGESVVRTVRWAVVLEVASMVVGPGEIKAAVGALGVGERLAGALRILAWLGRATETAAAERTALRLARLAEIMRAERAAFSSAAEVTELIAHLPKKDAQDLVRLVGRVDVVEGESLAQLAARSPELHDAVQQVMARAEVLKALAAKAGGLSDDVARGFAILVGRSGVEVEAAGRIVARLGEGEGARFLALLERTSMRGTNAATRAELLEIVAAAPARMEALGEFGTDLFRAVLKDVGGDARQLDRTLETVRGLQAEFAAQGRQAEFQRLAERLARGDEAAWRRVDDAHYARHGGLRAEVEADLAAVQKRISGVSADREVLRELGISEKDRIVGPLVDKFELGNFAHEHAELLIPESRLPRGLDAEFEFTLRDGSKRRPDRLDWAGGKVFEIKPDTAASVEAGQKQARLYAQWLDIEHPLAGGRKWAFEVVTYDAERLRQALRQVGDLRRWITGGAP